MAVLKFIRREEAEGKVFLSILNNEQMQKYGDIPQGHYITLREGSKLCVLVNANITSNLLGFILAKTILDLQLTQIVLDLTLSNDQLAAVLFALEQRIWKLCKYKSQPFHHLKNLEVVCNTPDKMRTTYASYAALILGQNLCKELAESPANIIYPETFAKQCEQLKDYGIELYILSKNDLIKLKMNALLAVSAGSSKEPQVVVMRYVGEPSNPSTLAFVGKGVCFDSGGLFIKDQIMMPKMKYDKSGAAAVVGGMLAIAAQKLKVNAVGVIGLVENMLDGNAMRPSDVVTCMNGKTVEIVDPDCEGRLVLADCLYYTQLQFKPSVILSFATLTGETVASLANEYAGLFTRDDSLAEELIGEPLWRLPLGEGFKKFIESDIADLKNRGINNYGENASAAEFLHEFVNDTKFAHIDIAGVAWCDEETLTKAKGATGYGVGIIEKYAKQMAS